MSKQEISPSVIRRLPRYHRFLGELAEKGTVRISSKELSRQMGMTASQIRQDLNCFGGFGQQGYGYNVRALYDEIGQILGVSAHRRTILIGLGNLGRAIAAHVIFSQCGCELIGLFDSNPFVAGRDLDGMPVHHTDTLSGFCHQEHPELAVLCVPENAAPELAKKLVSLGVRAFWNFSHGDLQFDDPAILVENVHLADSLLTLTYGLGHDIPDPPAADAAEAP
ncbi:MAG: redox-sensing transcriptional repressor Rex [Oscillospiraceae bacterium]|nr:redox-sensing transcriptional repressor Rex [Oscillospiraceae bacterium]MCR4760000.1 redox-sensing transcriptional repressor Rex [Oscillospiraceae bacterium]